MVTGISGSGKSSLVIDTVHSYGLQEMTKQFSSYQRSRVGVDFQLDVERIDGLSPSICVTRKEKSFTERSDIAKQTGIEKILRFAFSRKAQYGGKDLSASHFSNNHELGKCVVCDGLGEELLPDLDKIVIETDKSIKDGLFEHNKALAYYGQPGSQYMAIVEEVGKEKGFSCETVYRNLNKEQRNVLFHGTGEKVWKTKWEFRTKTRKGSEEIEMQWKGLFHYLQDEYFKTRKNKNIAKLKALFSPSECTNCSGSGLKPDRLQFKIGGRSIHEIKSLNFTEFENWLISTEKYDEIDQKLISKIQPRLINTINRAKQLHIDHLQLNRRSNTLSGGENQRVALIKQLNSPLKGITYLLDEPSAGLSMDNIPDLIAILRELVDKGNTVIVIEHNKEIIFAADRLVQLGPKAGKFGGYITYEGTPEQFLKEADSHEYLKEAPKRLQLNEGKDFIEISNLSKHTLKKERLEVPVGGITAISGKSGIGKTTLVKEILIPSIRTGKPVNCESIKFPSQYSTAYYFETKKLRSHSNTLLVSYLDLLKEVCRVFAKNTNLKARDFSYKTKTSQCFNCKGKGFLETSLDITANSIEICEECNGQRYEEHILEHSVQSKNIAEVLSMNITEFRKWLEKNEAQNSSKITNLLKYLQEIGLSHLSLEQPVQSLSSGEKQRLLLLNWLMEKQTDALYVLDEPSTGLHYSDIDLLFNILQKISEANDILVIDHNPYLLEKIKHGIILN